MSYTPTTDFLALLRQTGGGVRTERMPGLDYVVAAMVRAGLFAVQVGQVAPAANQVSTVWFKPALSGSWTAEGAVFLYDASLQQYAPASPALWSALLVAPVLAPQVQDITAPGPAAVAVSSTVVRVNQTAPAPIILTMPPAVNKVGPVLISDWKGDAGANNITVNLTGADKFPGNLSTWVIAADTGSIFLRPVPGGYVL